MFTNNFTEKANLDIWYGRSGKIEKYGSTKYDASDLKMSAKKELALIKTEKDRKRILKDIDRLARAAKYAATDQALFLNHLEAGLFAVQGISSAKKNDVDDSVDKIASAALSEFEAHQKKKNILNLPGYLKVLGDIEIKVRKMKLPMKESEDLIILMLEYQLGYQDAVNEMMLLESTLSIKVSEANINGDISTINECKEVLNEAEKGFIRKVIDKILVFIKNMRKIVKDKIATLVKKFKPKSDEIKKKMKKITDAYNSYMNDKEKEVYNWDMDGLDQIEFKDHSEDINKTVKSYMKRMNDLMIEEFENMHK